LMGLGEGWGRGDGVLVVVLTPLLPSSYPSLVSSLGGEGG
jgi:hypothetical protein